MPDAPTRLTKEANAFPLWLSSRFCSNFAKQMQATAVAWQIYQLSRDPLALGLIGLAEAIPFLTISLWAGHLIDRNEKKAFLVGSEAGLLLGASGYFSTTFVVKLPILLLYLLIGVTGFCTSFENISASAYAQLLIPKEKFPRAAAWNLIMFQAAMIAGPLFAGLILTHASARVVYGIGMGLFVVSLLLASWLHPMHVSAPAEEESALKRVALGLRFIRSQPRIFSAMSLDMVAVLFGDAVALFPVFADRLHAGAIGFGCLLAAPAVGSALLSMIQAARPFIRTTWRSMRITVVVFGLSMIGFAFAKNIYMTVAFLAVGGMADGVSVIIRQSIYQALTPDHLRGRVSSVSGIFISTSNEIGAFESGLAARLFGVVPSVLIGSGMTLLSVAVMSRIFKESNYSSSTPA